MSDENHKEIDFSIIIPSFNSESCINEALSSCLNQNVTIEVILIDGLSRDRTVEIARKHPANPIILSEPDQGIYDAINKGMNRSQGKLIGVLGSDDTLEPFALNKLKHIHNHTRTDIVFGAANMVSESGNMELRVDETYGFGALLSGIPFCHNAMFVTQDCKRRVGSYKQSFKICGDADWVHRAIKLGCTASGIPDPVVRFSLGGLSSTNAETIMAETYAVIAANFNDVTEKEAKILIEAVRCWGPVEPALEIAKRYPDDLVLQKAIAEVFNNEKFTSQTVSNQNIVGHAPSRWRKLLNQIFFFVGR